MEKIKDYVQSPIRIKRDIVQNILFRANSSSTIGTGHIMRDFVLAEQFKNAFIKE